jgi:hypothetical protein
VADGEGPDRGPTADASPADERSVVRGIRFVPAEPQAIFDLLADPSQHPLIDGSGTLRAPTGETPERLDLGSQFGMSMRWGMPYRMTNEVVEFEEPNLIAWRHVGRHVWRYRLRPVDGGTEVTEEFDWTHARSRLAVSLIGAPQRNARSIEATLDRLVDHFSADSPTTDS